MFVNGDARSFCFSELFQTLHASQEPHARTLEASLGNGLYRRVDEMREHNGKALYRHSNDADRWLYFSKESDSWPLGNSNAKDGKTDGAIVFYVVPKIDTTHNQVARTTGSQTYFI